MMRDEETEERVLEIVTKAIAFDADPAETTRLILAVREAEPQTDVCAAILSDPRNIDRISDAMTGTKKPPKEGTIQRFRRYATAAAEEAIALCCTSDALSPVVPQIEDVRGVREAEPRNDPCPKCGGPADLPGGEIPCARCDFPEENPSRVREAEGELTAEEADAVVNDYLGPEGAYLRFGKSQEGYDRYIAARRAGQAKLRAIAAREQ